MTILVLHDISNFKSGETFRYINISDLVAKKRTINFVTSKGRSNYDSMSKQFPDAITCGNGVIFYFRYKNLKNVS